MMDIKECTEEYWDAFVDNSPQGTVFNKSFFLKSYNCPVRYLICWKGEEAIAGFACVERPEGIQIESYQHLSGMIFRDLSYLINYRRNETIFLAMEAFAAHLFDRYREVAFSCHWDITDLRAFDWLNYHERDKGYYQVAVRHTSLLDISSPEDTSGYARNRVRELNKGIEAGDEFVTREINDVPLLDRLHAMNFTRQGVTLSAYERESLISICQNLTKAGAGQMLATYVNEKPAVAIFFIYDKARAYALFVGMDLDFKDLGVGTKNIQQSCVFLNKNLGIKELDFVGANSPLRSAYKLSYGGRLVPYFKVSKMEGKVI